MSSSKEAAQKPFYFLLGLAFGFLFLSFIGAFHASVFWWILGCAVFAAGSTRQWLVDPASVKSSLAKWCWASFGAFIGAFVPYILYCLTHIKS